MSEAEYEYNEALVRGEMDDDMNEQPEGEPPTAVTLQGAIPCAPPVNRLCAEHLMYE